MSIDNLDLSSERPGINYYQLRDLLAAKQWVEADRETAERMCEVMQQPQRGWLKKEYIENFPCHDLNIIDKLWLYYSEGKFGFSVQKHIWEKCGRPTQYNEDWKKFTARIGWINQGNWMTYTDITKSLSEGSLPLCVSPARTRFRGGFWILHIFFRAEKCKL
jgi:hypothetical protein